jgi:hypothetical protein
MNITKEKFTKLAKEHLLALESYKMNKNGNKPLKIFGIEELYEAISVMQYCEELKVKDVDNEWIEEVIDKEALSADRRRVNL